MINASTRMLFQDMRRASAMTFGVDDRAFARADFRHKMSAISRADDRSAARHDAAGAAAIQDDKISRRQETFETIEKAENFEIEFLRGERDAAQDGVQSGTIAAAGQNADAGLHVSRGVIREASSDSTRGRRRPIDRKVASRAPAFARLPRSDLGCRARRQ